MHWFRAATSALVLAVVASAPPAWAQSTQPAPRPAERGVLPPNPSGTQARPAPAPPPKPATAVPASQAPARPAASAPATAPAQPAAAPAGPPAEAPPSEAVLGAPVYPNATFLGSFDAGQNQRYYLFGTSAAYQQVLQFYRTALKDRGDEVFDIPPIWSFDIGRYREQTMAYPPSVTVRDHMAGGGKGYLHAGGGEGQRYATVIQVVPPVPGERR
jgi:hypothetical protein